MDYTSLVIDRNQYYWNWQWCLEYFITSINFLMLFESNADVGKILRNWYLVTVAIFYFLVLYTNLNYEIKVSSQATEIDIFLRGSDHKRYCTGWGLLGKSETQCAIWARKFLLVLNDYVSYGHTVMCSAPYPELRCIWRESL